MVLLRKGMQDLRSGLWAMALELAAAPGGLLHVERVVVAEDPLEGVEGDPLDEQGYRPSELYLAHHLTKPAEPCNCH